MTEPGVLSIPEDIQFRDSVDQQGVQIVYNHVERFYPSPRIEVKNEDMESIKKTLSLAKSHNTMVLLDDVVTNAVHIPVINVKPVPEDFRFVVVNPGGWGWIKSWFIKYSRIEIWYKDTFVGMTCFDCFQHTMDNLVKQYTFFLEDSYDAGLDSIEINLTKDSENIFFTDSEFTYYDPKKIGIHPGYFKEMPEVPGIIRLYEFQKDPDRSQSEKSELAISTPATLIAAFTDKTQVLWHPVQTGLNTIQFSHVSIHELNNQEVKVKGVAVVDGLRSMPLHDFTGSREFYILAQYNSVFRTYSRVLAKAIAENKRVAVNRDRRGALQMLLTVEK